MNNPDTNLPSIIYAFLRSLPKPIAPTVLVFVVQYATHNFVEETDALLPAMEEFLLCKQSRMDTIGAILSTISAIDFVLFRFCVNLPNADERLKDLAETSPFFAKRILQLPLENSHYQKTYADWRALRATKITFDAILLL